MIIGILMTLTVVLFIGYLIYQDNLTEAEQKKMYINLKKLGDEE